MKKWYMFCLSLMACGSLTVSPISGMLEDPIKIVTHHLTSGNVKQSTAENNLSSSSSAEENLPQIKTASGCSGDDSRKANDNTNLEAAIRNQEHCNVNFQQMEQINSNITSQAEKRPAAQSESVFSKSTVKLSENLVQDKISIKNEDETSHRESVLQFLEIPKGDDMRLQNLGLEEEYLLFEPFSDLMGYLHPSGFPSGVLKELLQQTVSAQLLVFQILKMDFVLVIWIVIWAVLALCLPFGVAANLCCSNGIRRLEEDVSIGSINSGGTRTENVLGILLHILLLLLLAPIILILAGNEQLSRSISKLPMSAGIIYEDIETFLRNTHMQISFVVTSSTDVAIEGIKKDLEAVNSLIGQPFQEELSSETGIDVALLALEDLKSDTARVASLILELLTECASARIASTLLQDELNDVSRQLTVTRQQCTTKDRPLCFTLQYSGFDLAFSLENITNDVKIKHLEKVGLDTTFNNSIEIARKSFTELPKHFASEAASLVADTKAVMIKKRTEVYKSTHAVDVLARSLGESLSLGREQSLETIRIMADWDLWRWLAVLGIASVLSLVWGLLLCGAPCGCGITYRTVPILLSGLAISCFTCIFIWVMGSAAVFLGVHGKRHVCDPLYDYPKFVILEELLDKGGIVYQEGLLELFEEGNSSLKLAEVLKYSQRDQTAYKTFHLGNQLNVSKVINYKEWEDLKMVFANFTTVGGINLEILDSSLQLNLQTLIAATTLNATAYRYLAASPITKRDLNSFADQLNTVARQLSDPVSARKFDNLAFSVRKVDQNELHKLAEIKNSVLYKMAMLEVLLGPLHKQSEQALAHLKAIQYFVDNEGWQVAEKIRKRFVVRLETYLEELYNYVFTKVTKEVGKCRPLWEIFHAARFHVCKLIVDPLNGIAFFSFFLIFLLLTVAPIVVKLADYYRGCYEEELTSISHRTYGHGPMLDDDGIWSTPSSDTPEIQPPLPPERPHTAAGWTSSISPLQRPSGIPSRIQSPGVREIPTISILTSPKRKISIFTSTLAKARNLTQMSVSRARSPRRGRKTNESLRLVEPIAWKSGSTTPRSWI